PHCNKKHTIDEKKIPANATKARCTTCGKSFTLNIKRPVEKKQQKQVKKGDRIARKIGISLSKGGVGKSTTSVNLASGLALAGFKVLLIDTDTQGQDSFMLGVKPKAGLTELVTGELALKECLTKARDNLWMLAGGKALAGVKRMIDRKDYGGELTIAEAMVPVDKIFDYVIIDTSPGWDPLTVSVLFYVNELLIPVALDIMALQGLSEFLRSISSIQKYRPELSLKYILPTFEDKRVKKTSRILSKIAKIYGERLCKPVRYNVRLSEAPAYGKTIYEYAPGCNGARDYRELVRKVANDPKLLA
ncbi:MAG: AAA family ATPase, partial [Desulfobacterales bacterium]|nr:AAA family ATPase [Desulfobacterales bacterium]